MPQENGKEEIIRHGCPTNVQPRNNTFKSPYNQDFAEIYIENGEDGENGENGPFTIVVPPPDKKSEIFTEMRRLVYSIGVSGNPYGRLQTALFYKQARFMEGFEDDYDGNASFSMYFPDYQSMKNDQLHTYFSWRSKVRAGQVRKTSFSYVFVYIYELINNIGVYNCEDGLDKLIFIWNEYKEHESKLDKYMTDWVRDYYITNDFTVSFEALLGENGTLRKLYPRSDSESPFDFYCAYSEYKIKQSAFFTQETAKRISDCFDHVVVAINQLMGGENRGFNDLVFSRKGKAWSPFSKALYSQSSRKTHDKAVHFLHEEYRFKNGNWTQCDNKVCTKNGRLVVGYILKRIEQFFRKSTKFKYKLIADKTKIDLAEIASLIPDTDSFFGLIDSAIIDYYKQSQRKTITVNTDRLETIRANALLIQEKLLANSEETEEHEEETEGAEDYFESEEHEEVEQTEEYTEIEESKEAEEAEAPPAASSKDSWNTFADSLDQTERTAVQMILRNASVNELHAFSKSARMMLEVLIDNINRKAIETLNDNLFELSDGIAVFEEYKEDLERVMRIERQ